jgi:hypothetical protein
LSTILQPTLHNLPTKFGCFYHFIQVCESFYNIHYNLIHSHNDNSSLCHRPCINTKYKQRFTMKLLLHYLLFLIYSTLIFTVTLGVHQERLPLAALSAPPAIILSYFLLPSYYINHLTLISTSSMPSIMPTSMNHQKLYYLTAWQSTHASTYKLISFPMKRLCVLTPAPVVAFATTNMILHPTLPESVLHGISSGLPIKGICTIKWTLQDNLGNYITMFLPNNDVFLRLQCAC